MTSRASSRISPRPQPERLVAPRSRAEDHTRRSTNIQKCDLRRDPVRNLLPLQIKEIFIEEHPPYVLGHRSILMTMRYSHLSPDRLRDAASLDSAWTAHRLAETVLAPVTSRED